LFAFSIFDLGTGVAATKCVASRFKFPFHALFAVIRFDRTEAEPIRLRQRGRIRESWLACSSPVAVSIISISTVVLMAGCGERLWPNSALHSSNRVAALPAAPAPRIQHRSPKSPPTRIVRASWYGARFRDRKTASGERFDPNRMTAASKTLPMGSVVHVTNLENGRSVTVRINDRGPYVRGRSLDLSRRAARAIGLTKKGVARVKVTPARSHADPAVVSTQQ
jgi:Lytic transglycolase